MEREEEEEEEEEEREEAEVIDDGECGDITSPVYVAPGQNEKSTIGILTKKTADWVDAQCKELHKQLRWQSDKDMPRTSFPTGISCLAKMTGNERTGVLLLLLLVVCIDNTHHWAKCGQKASKRKFSPHETGYLVWILKKDLADNMMKILSLLLLLEGFLKCTRVPLACMETVKKFVPTTLEGVFNVFPRIGGTGNATIKSHLVAAHMVEDIYRFGSAENYNSGPMESSHIQNIKQPGKNTQKRTGSFAVQVSNHYCRNIAIERAYKDHPDWKPPPENKDKKEIEISTTWFTITETNVFFGDPSKDECGDDSRKRNIVDKLGDWDRSGSGIQVDELVQMVRTKILPHLSRRRVTVHRTMTKGGQKFQANPCYGTKEQLARQHWAMMGRRRRKQGGGYIQQEIPVHLQILLHIGELKQDASIEMDAGYSVKEEGYYFLAHTIERELKETGPNDECGWGEEWNYGTLAEQNQKIIHMAKKAQVGGDVTADLGQEKRDAVILVPVVMIESGMVGVLDPNHSEIGNRFYFFILRHCEWGRKFMDEAEEEEKRQAG